MRLLALSSALLSAAASGAMALDQYQFPDCKAGPLHNLTICDPTANYWDRAQSLVKMFTPDELINNTVSWAPGVPRLDVAPRNWWSEALHGVAHSPGVKFANASQPFSSATSFPNVISLGASFDNDLYAKIGNIIKREVRAYNNAGHSGINLYSPSNINAFRDPRWGRGQETPGEDLHHISSFVRTIVPAIQGTDPVKLDLLITAKHYLGYDVENDPDRHSFDAQISVQDLAEFYLPQFKAALRDAKAASLMSSYNAVNGVPTSASAYFLQTLARDTWQFDATHNYVTSDCDAIADVFSSHNYTKTAVEAAADSLNAGVDLDCGPTYGQNLAAAIAQNLTTLATVELAVTRMYASLVRLGVFDPAEDQPLRQLGWADVNNEDAQQLAYQAAVEGITLLKNDGILPASPNKFKNVALIGPSINATMQLTGNYAGPPQHIISIGEGISGAFTSVTQVQGTGMNVTSTDGFAAALSAAQSADLVIFAGGIDNTIESESKDRTSIAYPGNQADLITQLAALGKPMVLLQMGGGQVDNSAFKANANVSAIVWAGYPSQAGGKAIADVLTGKYAPAGRLPVTQYPAEYVNQVSKADMSLRPSASSPGRTYVWYDDAVYPFAHGLHYTNFSATLGGDAGKSVDIGGVLNGNSNESYKDRRVLATVDVAIKNTGSVASDYTAMLYANSTNGPAPYPRRKLVAYSKVHALGAGAGVTVSLPITVDAVARVETNGDMVLYPGTYNLFFDNWEAPLASATLTLTGERIVVEAWPQNPSA